ncbi:MAG: hypothetical protein QG608_481 [Actinomycetota bacterium]|nr:hypothetical protein [Actinomycetota bacterium]
MIPGRSRRPAASEGCTDTSPRGQLDVVVELLTVSFRKGLPVTHLARTELVPPVRSGDGPSRRRPGVIRPVRAGFLLLLVACASCSAPEPGRRPVAQAPPRVVGQRGGPAGASPAAGSSQPCREGAFALHLSLARGAFDTYLRDPYEAGEMSGEGDSDKTAAEVRAGQFVVRQLAAAASAIESCPGRFDLLRTALLGSRAVRTAVVMLRAGQVSPSALTAASRAVDDATQAAREARFPVVPELPGPSDW